MKLVFAEVNPKFEYRASNFSVDKNKLMMR